MKNLIFIAISLLSIFSTQAKEKSQPKQNVPEQTQYYQATNVPAQGTNQPILYNNGILQNNFPQNPGGGWGLPSNTGYPTPVQGGAPTGAMKSSANCPYVDSPKSDDEKAKELLSDLGNYLNQMAIKPECHINIAKFAGFQQAMGDMTTLGGIGLTAAPGMSYGGYGMGAGVGVPVGSGQNNTGDSSGNWGTGMSGYQETYTPNYRANCFDYEDYYGIILQDYISNFGKSKIPVFSELSQCQTIECAEETYATLVEKKKLECSRNAEFMSLQAKSKQKLANITQLNSLMNEVVLKLGDPSCQGKLGKAMIPAILQNVIGLTGMSLSAGRIGRDGLLIGAASDVFQNIVNLIYSSKQDQAKGYQELIMGEDTFKNMTCLYHDFEKAVFNCKNLESLDLVRNNKEAFEKKLKLYMDCLAQLKEANPNLKVGDLNKILDKIATSGELNSDLINQLFDEYPLPNSSKGEMLSFLKILEDTYKVINATPAKTMQEKYDKLNSLKFIGAFRGIMENYQKTLDPSSFKANLISLVSNPQVREKMGSTVSISGYLNKIFEKYPVHNIDKFIAAEQRQKLLESEINFYQSRLNSFNEMTSGGMGTEYSKLQIAFNSMVFLYGDEVLNRKLEQYRDRYNENKGKFGVPGVYDLAVKPLVRACLAFNSLGYMDSYSFKAGSTNFSALSPRKEMSSSYLELCQPVACLIDQSNNEGNEGQRILNFHKKMCSKGMSNSIDEKLELAKKNFSEGRPICH